MALTKEQLVERRKYIGASECPAVLGLSRWATPLSIWAQKTGNVDIEEKESEAIELGNELEDYVARRFAKKTGKSVHRVNKTLFHKKYPFIAANLDRKVDDESAVLECKTCSAFKSKEWEGEEIPQEYILQCHHQLAVTGYEKAYIAVLIGNQDFKWKEIPRDEKIIKDILAREIDFWNKFVKTNTMPNIIKSSDDDTLDKLFPNAKAGAEVVLDDKYNIMIENLEALSKDKSNIEKQIKQIKNEFKAAIKENETGNTGIYSVTWKNVHKDSFTVEEQNYRTLRHKKINEEE
jgi:putative phage-type endonuclease